MKYAIVRSAVACSFVAFAVGSLLAKDVPVAFTDCPPAVQEVIKKYSAHGTLEGVALDEKKKSGGPATYEAKFTLNDARRIEVHITPDGKILDVEKKRSKE